MRYAITVLLAVTLCGPSLADEARDGVTVVLVRHAETAGDTSGGGTDPELSAAGRARAESLARELRDADVTHVFASEYARTRSTVAPVAAAAGVEVTVVPARQGERLAEALRALPAGAVAVVAGHSNTVPALVAALGGRMSGLESSERHGGSIPHDEYDRLVVLVLGEGGGPSPTVELRYGP